MQNGVRAESRSRQAKKGVVAVCEEGAGDETRTKVLDGSFGSEAK